MLLYRLIISVLWLPVSAVLFTRILMGRERFGDWLERLGFRLAKGNGAHIWLHAASNGEVISARPVILALRRDRPDLGILVTTNSVSGRDLVKSWNLEGLIVQLAPLDTRWAAARLRRRCRAIAHIVIESEFWLNRFAAMHAAKLPVAVLGARLSRETAQMWGRLPIFSRALQRRITFLSPQDEGSRRRLMLLGMTPEQCGQVLDLKSFYSPPKDQQPDASLRDAFVREQTWLAASTHPGEDEIVLGAHKALLETRPEAQLIIAPRHPKRGAKIVTLARQMGFQVALRSTGDAPRAGTVYIADTLGEMPLWYQLAGTTFVGGSLTDKGGHTPFEPAVFDSALLHGPEVRNFTSIYRKLDISGAAIQVYDEKSLSMAVLQLKDHERRDAMRKMARSVLDRPEVFDDVLNQILALLAK